MSVIKSQENGVLTLRVEGALNNKTSPMLEEALSAAIDEAKQIRVDFADTKYVSSAGLRVVLMGLKKAKKNEVSIKFANVSSSVLEVLDATGFSDIMDIE